MTTPPLWLLFDPSGQPREYWTKPPTVEELRSLGERQWRVVRYEAVDARLAEAYERGRRDERAANVVTITSKYQTDPASVVAELFTAHDVPVEIKKPKTRRRKP